MIALLTRWFRRPPPYRFRGSLADELVGHILELRDFPCAECGRPSVGWRFAVEDEAIEGVAVCAAHLGVAAW